MTDLKTYYGHRSESLSREISKLRLRNRYFVVGEILTFLLAISAVVLFTTLSATPWMLVAAVLMLAVYVGVRRMDEANGLRIDRLTSLRTVHERELCYLAGDFSPFDTGERYNDSRQPFAFDLDLFGPQSVFNRIDRTLTTGGSDYLAHCLSSLSLTRQEVESRRRSVDALACEKEWRAQYLALGDKMKMDTRHVADLLGKLQMLKLNSVVCSNAMPIVAYASLCVLAVLAVASVLTPLPASVPVMWAMGQMLFVCLFCKPTLAAISRIVDVAAAQTAAFSQLVDRVAALNAEASKAEELASWTMAARQAQSCLSELNKILKSLDRCNSFMGQILYSVSFMTVFLIHRFLRLQRNIGGGMAACVEAIERVDALVSMATFRFNEPAAGTAELVEGEVLVYEAHGLYHPFLGDKAVCNDFTIDAGNFYIVTGANMAGKSTFLRSLGVNYVLARNGMPVFAKRLRVSMFSLFSSMRTTDDLAHGISYFNAELLRLKQLIGYCRHQRHTLIILDEILKGTNSLDKLNGSRLFLEHISRLPVSGVIATHDLELAKMEQSGDGRFHNYCFEIGLSDRVRYSYKITPGVARNQNATFLLKQILAQ